VLLLVQQNGVVDVLVALAGAWLPSTVLLLLSPGIHAMLGARGSRAIERLTGMLLIMMSVQMVLDGVKDFTTR
jgi:multiple antibiotic resistance protein